MKKLTHKFVSAPVIQTHTAQRKSFSELDISIVNQKLDIVVPVSPITRNKLKKLLDEVLTNFMME